MTVAKLDELDDKSLRELCQKENIELEPGVTRDDMIQALYEALEEDVKEKEKLQALIIQIERSKFGYSPLLNELQKRETSPFRPLKETYDETYCGLLLRDPDWAFCFWEIKSQTWQQLHRKPQFRAVYLQLLENQTPEIGGPMNHTYRIKLEDRWGSRYIQLPKQGFYYQVDIVALVNGEREVLVQSPVVYSPPVNDIIRQLQQNSDPRYQVVLEISRFQDSEAVKALDRSSPHSERSNPHWISDWSEE